ncbi:MAG: hypothetical protein NVSMB1_19140 [Polyangiales bacterium]
MAAIHPAQSEREPALDDGDVAVDARPKGFVADLGAAAIELVHTAKTLNSVLSRTIYYCFRGRSEKGAFVRQLYEQGVQSVFFLTVFMGFFGMILVFQAGLQAKRVIPDLTLLGAT